MDEKLRFDLYTTQKLVAITARIDRFRGKWEHLMIKESPYLKELRSVATIQSTGSSTRIEGATLSDKEVESLMKNLQITNFNTREKQEVAGYHETLGLILNQFEFIELSISNIKTLHHNLMKFSDKDEHHRGKYKQFSNKVVATYPDGTTKTIFNTTPPEHTEREMETAVQWLNSRLGENDFHPLFGIGTFIYEFLSIHPFQDGNGRMSRLLTTLLLIKSGYPFVQFVSFEHIIEAKKTEYYRALMSGQQHRGTEKEIIHDWMLFFFQSLETLIIRLEEKYERYTKMGRYLNERQQKLFAFIKKKGSIQIGDATRFIPEVSLSTLKRDLKLLVDESLIERIGRGKGTTYRFSI